MLADGLGFRLKALAGQGEHSGCQGAGPAEQGVRSPQSLVVVVESVTGRAGRKPGATQGGYAIMPGEEGPP